ncbi:hypothetical protein CSOJ01_05597 [Colletotrichum sojae]|uniref:DUF6546 domain-containing protein n=1 Tax=Colletotrichum sojae TaxID=2175907 RepID=A0A8H6JFB4_9PEZI|nr:hypothetical protein CSOJ01_05597 [Colletotrichum sojae]
MNLVKYSCPDCGEDEPQITTSKNNEIFSDCLRRLFGTLSGFTTTGIALKLSAFSDSDLKHWKLPLSQHKRDLEGQLPYYFRNYFITTAKRRLFGHPLQLLPEQSELPKVTAVQRLLEHVGYHPWSATDEYSQARLEHANALLLYYGGCLTSLRSITLHEAQHFTSTSKSISTSTNAVMNQPAIMACLNLEELGVSRALNAFDFFPRLARTARATCGLGNGTGPALKGLVLTCNVQSVCRSRDGIDMLLLAAGKAAMYLPHLETMEVWAPRGGRREGFFFRYDVAPTRVTLTVGSTLWRGIRRRRSRAVLETWQRVGRQHQGHGNFEYFFKPIRASELQYTTSTCTYSKLKNVMARTA